jgi:hypothetical protein
MSRQYLKPDFEIIKMQVVDIIAQTGVNSQGQGVDYGGRDEGGFIDPSGNARNSSADAFWSEREGDYY